jgi:VWFA-related protein
VRRLVVSATLVSVLVVSGHAQDSRPQRFRAGVDLITIDVAAVDAKGRPVEDLRPGDFVVTVDGKPRPAVSAELIKVDRGKPAPRPNELVTTNQSPPNARRIIIAVDQTLITPGMITPLLRTASQFVARLVPSDYAAFIGFPEPGPRVDFTTDKAAVQKAMQTISIGQPARVSLNKFNISLFEALTITGSESIQNRSILTGASPGPIMTRVLARVTEAGQADLCPRLVGCIYDDSLSIVAEARLEGTISLRALEALLKELGPLEGSKSMVIFSAGMVNEDPSLLDGVKRLAAAARTTINVIAVDRDRGDLTSQANTRSPDALMDRSFELQGLETIADVTNGTLFRGIAAGAGIFERLESELSAWYLVAVERQPGDPESQRIEVDVKRRGVTVRSNKNAIAVNAAARRRPLDELLNEALSSPFTISGVPLRVSTFAQRDADPTKYRVRVATDIGQPGEPGGEFALGYVLTDEKGRVITSAGSRRNLAPTASGPNQLLLYDTSLAVAPGSYLLRFGVVDAAGRRGTLVRRVELPPLTDAEVQTSDLIVGNLPAEGETLAPRVEPQVTTSELAGYLELYVSETASANLAVTLDIAEGEASPALATTTLTLRPGETASSQVATGFVPATMTPGRYVARATVTRDGVTVKTLSRPITIVRDPAVVSRAPVRTRGVPITPELKSRAAAYVAGVVTGLANVVGEEAFTLSKPDRRVTSDLLLVRYPGRQRDLIAYRDVARVNGTPIEGREQRLVDLFVTPTEALREQARQIMLSADAYVPSAFNPMFVLGFLQSDFQPRFEFTVSDAGAEWPREVKAVAFVEVGRPTLLRTGLFGDFDAPTRGTAWIEEGTGRILQTELEIGRGRSAPKMVTRFRVDDRLQVTVPVEMRTENPDGAAKYSNFRRFGVETDAAIPLLPGPSEPQR